MRSACTWMPEKGTQTLSPSPDLIPAKNLTGNSHFDWYGKRGHSSGKAGRFSGHNAFVVADGRKYYPFIWFSQN